MSKEAFCDHVTGECVQDTSCNVESDVLKETSSNGAMYCMDREIV